LIGESFDLAIDKSFGYLITSRIKGYITGTPAKSK